MKFPTRHKQPPAQQNSSINPLPNGNKQFLFLAKRHDFTKAQMKAFTDDSLYVVLMVDIFFK